MAGGIGFGIEESAHRLGHLRWMSQRLFALLGGWVTAIPEPDVKLWVATASRHHGWHAELLEERLPRVGDLAADRVTRPADPAAARWFDEVDAAFGPDTTAERLTVVCRIVVPHVASVVRWHLESCNGVADAAVARTLGFVHADLLDEWQVGEATLQRWSASPDLAARIDGARAAYEPSWRGIGGISGSATWVDPLAPDSPSSP